MVPKPLDWIGKMKRILITIFILGIFSLAGASVYDAVREAVSESVKSSVNPLSATATESTAYNVTDNGGEAYRVTDNGGEDYNVQ